MHAAIAGLSTGVATLLVAWSHKYLGLMEDIGLDDMSGTRAAARTASLPDLFDRLWARRELIREHLLDFRARAQGEIHPHRRLVSHPHRPSDGAREDDVGGRGSRTGGPAAEFRDDGSGGRGPRCAVAGGDDRDADLQRGGVDRQESGGVLAQDYPADLIEILIADGRSDDGTVERVRP